MKKALLVGLAAVALILGACGQNTGVNDPVLPNNDAAGVALTNFHRLNLSDEQASQLDISYYLDEDLSSILTPAQVNSFGNIVNSLTPPDGRGIGRLPIFDMEAFMFFRLIMKADTTLTREDAQAILALIQASNKTRLEIIKANRDKPEVLKQLLQEEHERLMAEIAALVGPETIAKVEELKARLEQQRLERIQKMIELRVTREVEMLTKYLELNDEQGPAVKTALINYYTEIERLRAEFKGDPEGLRNALQQLQASFQEQMKTILTPEQYELWLKMRGGRGGVIIGPRG